MNTATIEAAIEALPLLRDNLASLDDSSQRFASDLIAYHARRNTLTAGQAPWVGKLLDRVEAFKQPTEPERAESIGDATGIKALFDRAACHLKHPAVVIQVPDVGMVRVYIPKPQSRSRYQGKTVVADYDKPYPFGKVYGIVRDDGMFEPKKYVETPAALLDTLKDFAADPVKHARAYGRLTGKCCFCRIALDDPRSTAQGYGPICARHFELPWGERPADGSVFLASDESPDQGEALMAGLEPADSGAA